MLKCSVLAYEKRILVKFIKHNQNYYLKQNLTFRPLSEAFIRRSLSQLHSADDDAVSWLTSYGS